MIKFVLQSKWLTIFRIMIRTLITPEQQEVSIHIPENYVGRQIEVLLYATDE